MCVCWTMDCCVRVRQCFAVCVLDSDFLCVCVRQWFAVRVNQWFALFLFSSGLLCLTILDLTMSFTV